MSEVLPSANASINQLAAAETLIGLVTERLGIFRQLGSLSMRAAEWAQDAAIAIKVRKDIALANAMQAAPNMIMATLAIGSAAGVIHAGTGTALAASLDDPTSVFFSGTDSPEGLSYLPQVGNYKDYGLKEWSSGDCSDWKVQQDLQNMPATVTTLAGWSRGRLGPGYFLETATQSQKDQIRTIILFDPGNTTDFTNGGCETDPRYNYDFNKAYADWLASNPNNHLIIYTGAVSEESPAIGPDPQQPIAQQMNNGSIETPRYTFAGLWKYYLAGIWNQPFTNRAQMCDYPGMSHEDVLKDFAYTVQNPQNGCPVAPDGQQPTAWNP